MIEEVVMRKASMEDLAVITKIVADSLPILHASGNRQWDENYPQETHFIADINNGELWAATCRGDVVGFVAITRDQPEEYSDCGLDISEEAIVPHRLAVAPSCRGAGIAKRMMKQAELVAVSAGISKIRVDTNSKNSIMQRLFHNLGYEYCGEIIFKNKPVLPEVMKFVCFEKNIIANSSTLA